MSEFAEDLDLPALPPAVEAFFARERAWHRFLRGTGAMSADEVAQELRRWVEDETRR